MFVRVVRMLLIGLLLLLAGGAVAFAALGGGDGTDEPPVVAGPQAGREEGVLTDVSDQRLVLQPKAGGERQSFGLRPIDKARLDLFHLLEHSREKWPVILHWEVEDGKRYATRVDDAPL